MCTLTAETKTYKSIIKKKKKKHDKVVFLAKAKLNTVKNLIYKALINSHFNHDKFVSVNNVLQENNEMKEEIKSPKNAVVYTI